MIILGKNVIKKRKRKNRTMVKIFRNKLVYLAVPGCFVLLIVSVFAPALATQGITDQSMANRFEPPNRTHLLGTDEYGRDVFSRLLFAIRTSTIVSISSIIISLVIGSFIGILAGYKSGWMEIFAVELANVFLAFPTIILGILVLVAIGSGSGNVIIALSIAYTPRFILLARSSTLSVKGMAYVEAARVGGVSNFTIMLRHIMPNVIGPCIVSGSLWIATAIRAESVLSFIGMGIRPPDPSLGNMISGGLRYIMVTRSLVLYPALTIIFVILSLNMLGDVIRDVIDPRIY